MAHWPRQAAPGAREWMLANMETADVTDFDAIVRLGGEAEEVKFDFSFINAKGHYLRPMPPITGGAGAGQVDLKRFALAVDDGVVTPEGGGPLNVAGSTFVIADLDHGAERLLGLLRKRIIPAATCERVNHRIKQCYTVGTQGFMSRQART